MKKTKPGAVGVIYFFGGNVYIVCVVNRTEVWYN